MVRQLLVGQGVPIVEASHLHSDKPHLVGLVISPMQRPLPDYTQHSKQTSMPPAVFEPAIPNKQADADPRLRMRDYCDQRRDSLHNTDTVESNNLARNYLHFTNKSPLAFP
jgi:hypothetical protein